MMNEYEYDFLKNNWQGEKGAAYNQVFSFCRAFGWIAGFDHEQRPILTKKGLAAMAEFERKNKNDGRIDVI